MKRGPYLFILILLIVLFFILGVRYGQNVEKNNKVINYVLSITPYPTYTPFPTITPTINATTSPTLINLKK